MSRVTNKSDIGKLPVNKVEKTKLNDDKGPTFKKGIKAAKTGKQKSNHVITGYKLTSPNLT